MNCHRCDGLMVVEQLCDFLDDTGQLCFDALRCILCGEIVDKVVLSNRGSSGISVGRDRVLHSGRRWRF